MKTGGDCFEAAFSLFMRLAREGKGNSYNLVHGVVTSSLLPTEGLRHVHAWLEYGFGPGKHCIDHSNGHEITALAQIYYAAGCIGEVRRYTVSDAISEALRCEHYGPWDEGLNRVQDAAYEALALRSAGKETAR